MFVPGGFWRICDRTGFKIRAFDTKKEWTGMIVRHESYEDRHPQDFVRGRKERIAAPDPRPEPEDIFLEPGDVTADSL